MSENDEITNKTFIILSEKAEMFEIKNNLLKGKIVEWYPMMQH